MGQRVLIAGAGTMGAAIGCCAAVAGNEVQFYDTSETTRGTVLERTAQRIAELENYGLCRPEAAATARARLSVAGSLEDGCRDVSLVIEAIYENLAAKQELFARLDRLVPTDVPILSNTSGLRITDIARDTAHPQRTLTAHFWLPAHLIPLVEIVVGEHSLPELAQQVKALLVGWGKSPVVVNRDLPGQLANRVLQAVIREAVNIVESGLASPEDVDTAISMGMALRFPVWGPLTHVDAVGLDVCQSVQNTVLPEISARRDASPLFAELIDHGHGGYRSGGGFYDWSVRDMAALERRRDEFIVFALKQIRAGKESA
ncbi:MAG: 3-hydroxyacyl-CoA dehydrogenase NAD-binding domain-containing protein [Micrococcales bacterium]|nr:3-hydroxyacyl-CoA dehydrogenase NAD-binding domain-containing protein [Micrococcales bacterium]